MRGLGKRGRAAASRRVLDAAQALPLAFPLRGILRANLYTYQWASMLSLLYLMEGVVRAMSDPAPLSVAMAWGEILLSTVFFVSAIFYVRPAKRAAQRA